MAVPRDTFCIHAFSSNVRPHTTPIGMCTVWQHMNQQTKSNDGGSHAPANLPRLDTTCPHHTHGSRASEWLCQPVQWIRDHKAPCPASHLGRTHSSIWQTYRQVTGKARSIVTDDSAGSDTILRVVPECQWPTRAARGVTGEGAGRLSHQRQHSQKVISYVPRK